MMNASNQPLHQILWQQNGPLVQACRDHPFVRQLGEGTLERPVFCRYVAQDAFFLQAFLWAYALALARCLHDDHARQIHALMHGVLEERTLHRTYAAQWDIDLEHVRPYRATRAYTDFLLRTAWHDSLGTILAAMTPCMRLYAFLGKQLEADLWDGHPYRDWIVTYASDGFASLAEQLESLLDATAADNAEIRDAYRYALECEHAFFSAPFQDLP